MTAQGRPSKQRKIFAAVAARGYVDGWPIQQLLARQVVKLLEESAELYLSYPWPCCAKFAHLRELATLLKETADQVFDDRQAWGTIGHAADLDRLRSEVADVQVVLACLAEVYNISQSEGLDLLTAALEKAGADKERGVR